MINSFFSLVLAHACLIGFVSCAVYHIVPSPDHCCPVEPCLTLSSFAANVSLHLDNNTLLIFQTGNHSLYSSFNIHITNVVNFSMISASNSTKDSNAGIICKNSSKTDFIFEAIDVVYINRLNFIGCEHIFDVFDYYNMLISVAASNLMY